jgi:DNA modification methylase
VIADDLRALAVPLALLDALDGNPRRGDVAAVVRSYERFGQRKPIVARRRADGRGEVTAGNTQLAAARELGWEALAVVWVDDDDDTARAWALADNRTSDLGVYDEAALLAYLESVRLTGDEELLAATGYSDADVLALAARAKSGRTDPDDVPEAPAATHTAPGDLWLCGAHRLLCGDATDEVARALVMGDERATVIYTDPPYGVGYAGGSKRQHVHQGDRAKGAALQALYDAPFAAAAQLGAGDCCVWVWYGAATDGQRALERACDAARWKARGEIVWVKNHAQFGRTSLAQHYHGCHEPLMYCFRPGHPCQWHGSHAETDVWLADRSARNDWHPTQKPVELGERVLANHSTPGEVVLDLYGGSGSTLIAAERTGRLARLIEIEPGYCDVICRRWQDYSGQAPVRAGTSEPVDFGAAA